MKLPYADHDWATAGPDAAGARGGLRLGSMRKGRYLMASAAADGASLLGWLRLLGFEIEIERDEEFLVGVARRRADGGGLLRVVACASSRGELAWQLFEGALKQLDQGRLRERFPACAPVVAA